MDQNRHGNNSLWDAFRMTGRIEDYLRYRGIDIYQTTQPHMTNQAGEERAPHAGDNRRPDHSGKQQYR